MIFLKFGGSLITNKTQENMPRMDVIHRLATEIQSAVANRPHRQHVPVGDVAQSPIVLGHGSGSFGHAAAKRHGTRDGVETPQQWHGFAEVSVIAARLNRIVADALHEVGLPIISFCPSASARCEDGRLVYLDTQPIHATLKHGLVPLVMGDVAFDSMRGGTIVSTEEVFAYLADELPVTHVLLAGETEGVYEQWEPGSRGAGEQESGPPTHPPTRIPAVIKRITPLNWDEIRDGVGGSGGADVTGGMVGKVRDMLGLVMKHPTVTARVFSGLVDGNVERALRGERIGTEIVATDDARLVGPDMQMNV